MTKHIVQFLNFIVVLAVVLTTGCDSTAIQEEEFDNGTQIQQNNDPRTTAELTGDQIEADLVNSASKHGVFGGVLSVMTRNMYVGTDVDAVIASPPEGVPAAVAQAWAVLQQTDFPGRMKALAKEIAHARPHLVGLQEVTTFRTQTPGDAIGGGTVPAEQVEMDFLATLLAELQNLGRNYRVVAQVQNIDVEMPLIHDYTTGFSTDIRLTDYDVILARRDVETSNPVAQNYQASFPVFDGAFTIKRGFVAVDAKLRGKTYRFVSTHLEPVETFDGYFQGLQAQELMGILAEESKPLILVGDLNTDAYTGDVYNALVASGYQDVWDFVPRRWYQGFTCCQAPDLANPVSQLDRRIDLILVKNLDLTLPWLGRPLTFSRVTGIYPWEKTKSGLWGSDHGGVAAWMLVPR